MRREKKKRKQKEALNSKEMADVFRAVGSVEGVGGGEEEGGGGGGRGRGGGVGLTELISAHNAGSSPGMHSQLMFVP